MAQSLRVGNPVSRSAALQPSADALQEGPVQLLVDQIRPYEHNPRRAPNERFEEIKASIRASGIRSPLTVTRRPGADHFIVEAGGNTRLVAVRQLWEETRDARFRTVPVVYRPWRSEAHVLGAHLVENELRGEMTFWDKADGIAALKARLEEERGAALSLRQLEEALRGLGMPVNAAGLTRSLFASARLRVLGEGIPRMSGLDVKRLQPQLNVLRRRALERGGIDEDELYRSIFDEVFRRAVADVRQGAPFRATAVVEACEAALAERLGEDIERTSEGSAASGDRRDASAGRCVTARPPAERRASREHDSGVPDPFSPLSQAVGTANSAGVDPAQVSGIGVSDVAVRDAALRRDCLQEQVRLFARQWGVEAALRDSPASWLGVRLDGEVSARWVPGVSDRQRAGWLLAGLVDACQALGADLPLRDPAPADRRDLVAPPGRHPAALLLRWLLDPSDPVGTSFWSLLNLARVSIMAREPFVPSGGTSPTDPEDLRCGG